MPVCRGPQAWVLNVRYDLLGPYGRRSLGAGEDSALARRGDQSAPRTDVNKAVPVHSSKGASGAEYMAELRSLDGSWPPTVVQGHGGEYPEVRDLGRASNVVCSFLRPGDEELHTLAAPGTLAESNRNGVVRGLDSLGRVGTDPRDLGRSVQLRLLYLGLDDYTDRARASSRAQQRAAAAEGRSRSQT